MQDREEFRTWRGKTTGMKILSSPSWSVIVDTELLSTWSRVDHFKVRFILKQFTFSRRSFIQRQVKAFLTGSGEKIVRSRAKIFVLLLWTTQYNLS